MSPTSAVACPSCQREATGFFHYPGHFLVLPVMFDWAKLVVGLGEVWIEGYGCFVVFDGFFILLPVQGTYSFAGVTDNLAAQWQCTFSGGIFRL